MDYASTLKALRSRLVESATGKQLPQSTSPSLESFISSRSQAQMPQESTDDIITRSANWVSEIKKASLEFQKAREAAAPKQSTSPVEGAIMGFLNTKDVIEQKREEPKVAEERREAFIRRRDENSPSTYAPQRPFETPIPVDAEMSNVLDALAAVESKGSGDYAAIGTIVSKGMYKGQRAYGRYQVMEGNIGPWTEAALGERLTVDEFMASPEAQDAVAAHQLQMAKDKHGTWEDAASVWFSGRPMSKAGNASDGHLTVPEYINKFRRNFVRA